MELIAKIVNVKTASTGPVKRDRGNALLVCAVTFAVNLQPILMSMAMVKICAQSVMTVSPKRVAFSASTGIVDRVGFAIFAKTNCPTKLI